MKSAEIRYQDFLIPDIATGSVDWSGLFSVKEQSGKDGLDAVSENVKSYKNDTKNKTTFASIKAIR